MSITIPVYKAERKLGLEDEIKSKSSILFASRLDLVEAPSEERVQNSIAMVNDLSIAGTSNQPDLHYLNTIMVSTGWNNNTDVFDRNELWKARATPIDKKFNYEHDESDIIGHITGCVIVDDDMQPYDDNVQLADLPETFHLATSAVLYKFWENPDLQDRMDNIILEISKGEWFVSMEALFTDFDYAMITPDGQHKIVARNESTAFLTKHLRFFGGTGEFEGNTIGRLVRNITFSGKGLVRKPANPPSVVLPDNVNPFRVAASDTKIDESESNTIERKNRMSEEFLKNQAEELKKENKEIKAALEEARQQASEVGVKSLKDQVSSLESSVEAKDSELSEAKAALEESKSKAEELEKSLAEAEEKKEEAETKAKEARDKLEKLESAMVCAQRKAQLVAAGEDEKEAEKLVETFAGLNDEQFKAIVDMKSEARKGKDNDEKDEKNKKNGKNMNSNVSDDDGNSADASDLDNAEEENDADLATGGDNNEAEELSLAVASYLSPYLGGHEDKS